MLEIVKYCLRWIVEGARAEDRGGGGGGGGGEWEKERGKEGGGRASDNSRKQDKIHAVKIYKLPTQINFQSNANVYFLKCPNTFQLLS